jgi:outer membrane receptor protein involved in Fe transport
VAPGPARRGVRPLASLRSLRLRLHIGQGIRSEDVSFALCDRIRVGLETVFDALVDPSGGGVADGLHHGGLLIAGQRQQTLDPFDEEKVIAYEVGTKSVLLDGRASLNFSAFYNDYTDYQLETLLRGSPRVLNIGDIKSKGIELEGRVLVTDNFELAGTYAYLDSKVKDSLDTTLIGNDTPQSPKHSASAQAHYFIPISSGEFKLSGILMYSDDFWFDIDNELDQPSVTKIDLRVGYTASSGRWGIAAFGDNVTDEEYFSERFEFLDIANRRAPGRLWRVELTWNF